MKCVSYTRVVPWKNAEFAMSVTEQNDMISSYIKGMKDCQLIHKYSDRKKNQTADEGFEQMIEDAMERKFECVVVASFYYCGYGFPIAKQMILDTLYAAGIRFVVVDESFDTDCISKNEVEAYFEEKRCEMHGDIIKNWRKSRGSSYVLTNSVSWGYERPNGKNHLIKDEAVSYYVAQVFQRIIKGEQYRCVADWLNAEGVDTPAVYRKKKQGKDTSSEINEWNASKVRGIVSSPVYTGVLVDTHKNIIASECHEPYISKEQFYFLRCNKSGRAKNNKIRADYRSPNPLAQRIFCGECGAAMSYKSIKGGYFYCYRNCKNKGTGYLEKIPADEINELVFQALMEEIRQAVSAEMQICSGKADGLLEQKIADISKQMKSILAEIDLEQFQRVPLYEQYMAKEISKEDYESACAAYEAESHILDKKLTVLMDEKRMYEKAFNIRNPWVTLFTLSSVHREFDRRTISKLVQKIEVFSNHGEIKVVLTPLMNEWKQLLPTEFLKEE